MSESNANNLIRYIVSDPLNCYRDIGSGEDRCSGQEQGMPTCGWCLPCLVQALFKMCRDGDLPDQFLTSNQVVKDLQDNLNQTRRDASEEQQGLRDELKVMQIDLDKARLDMTDMLRHDTTQNQFARRIAKPMNALNLIVNHIDLVDGDRELISMSALRHCAIRGLAGGVS